MRNFASRTAAETLQEALESAPQEVLESAPQEAKGRSTNGIFYNTLTYITNLNK